MGGGEGMGTIGENIIYFRKKRHLSQCELAKLMGVSQNAVYGWENNKRKPSIDILKKMSEILRITLYDIVEGNKPIEKSTCNIFPGIKVPAIDGKISIGDNIKFLRKRKNMTQKQLSEATGIAVITIQEYEAGKYEPKIDFLYKLGKALDCDIYKLAGINENINSHEITVNDVFNEIKKRAKEAETEEYEAKEKGDYLDAIESRGVHIALIDILKDFGQDGG
nr:MAG TPA: Helix-turn-helix XRE-family like protein [Caudoviricetes sp.]